MSDGRGSRFWHRFKYRDWRILTKLLVVVLALSLIPLLVVTWVSTRNTADAITQQTRAYLARTAHSTAQRIEQLLIDNHQFSQVAAGNTQIVALLHARTGAERARLTEDVRASLDNVLAAGSSIDLIGVYDARGTVVAHSSPDLEGRSYLFRDYVQAALAGHPFISDMQIGWATDLPGVHASAPVFRAAETDPTARGGTEVVGAVAIRIRGQAITEILKNTLGTESREITQQERESIDVYLVDEHGIVMDQARPSDWLYRSLGVIDSHDTLAKLSSVRLLGGVCPKSDPGCDPDDKVPRLPQPIPGLQPLGDGLAQAARAGGPASVRYCRPDNLDVLSQKGPCRGAWHVVGYAPVRDPFRVDAETGARAHLFFVLVDVPEEVFLRPVRRQWASDLGLAAVLALLVVASSLALSRTLAKPIENLTLATDEIARGQFGRRLPVRTGDEVGALAQHFNRMAEQLQASYAEMEERVQERTRELRALYDADEHLYREVHLESVLQALVDVAIEILQADKSGILLLDERRTHLDVRAARGFSPEIVSQRFDAGQGVMGQVVGLGQAVYVEDARTDPRVEREVALAEQMLSYAHVPIRLGDEVAGVFNVSYTRPHAMDENKRRLLIALAQRAALAIERARRQEQAEQLAVLEERQRIARDLHDAVSQTLFSANTIAGVLPRIWGRDPEDGTRRLAELAQLTQGALAEMRTLLLELRPAALVGAELDGLLRQLADAATVRLSAPVQVTVEGTCDLPIQVKVALYRIAQEALNNVIKHAGAGRVSLSLTCEPGRAGLTVADDGCGFDPAAVPTDHLGLRIMRERAQEVGAALEIVSAPDRGTQVIVAWERRDLAEGSEP